MARMNMNLKHFERKKPIKVTLERLMSYISAYKLKLVAVFVAIAVSSVAGVCGSLFIKTLIDDYIAPLLLEANPDFSGLLTTLIIMGVIYFSGAMATYIYNRLMITVAQGVLREIRDDMFEHMQKLPVKYFDTHTHGDVMSHYTNDTDTLRQMISQSIPNLWSSAITVISVFFAMLFTSVYLTVFVIAFIMLMLFISKKVSGNSGKYFIKQQKSLGETNGYIEEMINGQRVIKAFCHEEETKSAFDLKNNELKKNSTLAHKFANILMPIMGNLGHVQYVLIGILGGFLSLSGISALTLGAVGSFMQLSKSFSMPINQISQQVNSIVMALAGAERIFELLDEEPEMDEGDVTLVKTVEKNGVLTESEKGEIWAWKLPEADGSFSYTKLTGDVRMYEVDFGYTEEKTVLHDISLYAEPGQKVAFVGSTGAGKTTITNLINRFYDIADGKIRYDGININRMKKSSLRASLGMVLQDVNLFSGTVMDNIRYGRTDATDEECINAAKLVNAHDFITRLPDGYNTFLSENAEGISQGQKQLISIARAAVANPPVMILDEATSSIDTRTEALVQKGMDALMKGRTVFVIAHRLSTVRNSDVIMVLEKGKIIERGTHEQLLEDKGRYYSLYTGKSILS